MIKNLLKILNSDKNNFLLLVLCFVLAAVYYLSDIGQQSIRYSDEATHVRVIQEMYASGDFLNPTLDGQPYLNKPPLKMWLTLLVISSFGESNFTYRLIDGLCSAAIVCLVLFLGLKIFNKRLPALIAAFSLLASEGFFVTARQNSATQDAFVVFCNTLSIVLVYLIFRRAKHADGLLLSVFFGLSLAAGVLTKSVVGIVPLMVLVPVFIFNFEHFKKHQTYYLKVFAYSACSFLLPVLAYYGQLMLRVPDAWSRVFGYDIKQRLLTEGFHNSEKWWYYLERLFVDSDFVPAWILVLACLSLTFLFALKRDYPSSLLFFWAFTPLVVFSCLQSRAFHYIAPAFPALALGIGQLFLFNANRISRFVLLLVIIGLTHNFFLTSKRLIREEKKLPVERFSAEFMLFPDIYKVYEYKLDNFLEGDTYQRWRQQFYLDITSRNRIKVDKFSDVKLDSVLILPAEEAINFVKQFNPKENICGYWPLIKPEKKKQSISAKVQLKPDAMAFLITDCKSALIDRAENLIKLDRKILFTEEQGNAAYFGIQTGLLGEIESITGPNLAFSLNVDSVHKELSNKFIFRAAVLPQSNDTKEAQYINQKVQFTINSVVCPEIEIAGGNLRDYSVKIPEGALSAGDSLVVVRQLSNTEKAAIVLKDLSLVRLK